MYGPSQAPQTPPRPPQSPATAPAPAPATGGQIALRVLFVALPLLSCGFLAGAPLLRLAVLTRKARDWWFFGIAVVVSTALFVYMGVTGEKESSDLEAVLGVAVILLLGAGSMTYYLVGEIRHFDRDRQAPVPPSPYPPAEYGYGATAVTVPTGGTAPAQTPYIPAPARIDQVRAELDELSDLLRKDDEDGRR